jgi:hypothetical protein
MSALSDIKRHSDKFKGQTKTTYRLALFSGDDGMWTVIEVTEKPVFMAPSQHAAEDIIKRMGGELTR